MNPTEHSHYEIWYRPIPEESAANSSPFWYGGRRNNYSATDAEGLQKLNKKMAAWRKKEKHNEFKIVKIRHIRVVEDVPEV